MIIDLILIALIVFSAYRGYKKGLIGIVISLVALILSIFLGFVLKDSLANYLYNNTFIGKSIEERVTNVINENLNTRSESTEVFEEILSKQENPIALSMQEMPKVVTMFVLKILSFVLILIFVYIICMLLQMLLNLFVSLPVISSINKIGGGAINVLQMLVKIWIVLAIVYFVIPIQETNTLSKNINDSLLTKTLYQNNFFVSVIESNINM